MDAGRLKEKIQILSFTESEKGDFAWHPEATPIYAEVKMLKETNLFSKVGIGAQSAKFVLRRRSLTLHNAFLWKEQHYFLTDIQEIDRMYLEVTAALVEVVMCSASHAVITKSELNRPISGIPVIIKFSGCLIEKYLGWTQEKPMSQTEMMVVLITPKAISISPGDLIEIGSEKYLVCIEHTLDSFKNEYEMFAQKDV